MLRKDSDHALGLRGTLFTPEWKNLPLPRSSNSPTVQGFVGLGYLGLETGEEVYGFEVPGPSRVLLTLRHKPSTLNP